MDQIIITEKGAELDDEAVQEALCARGEIPSHVAIIMDGNGRWAQTRGQNRVVGHHEGVRSVRDITEACAQLGVQYLTLYTFSTENWHRPAQEVDALMQLLIHTLQQEVETMQRNNIRLRTIGAIDELPEACRQQLSDAMASTDDNTRMTLQLALSYSGRWDILQAARRLAARVQAGEITPEDIDEDAFSSALATSGAPDPDLLIRTGGDYRVSNYLLWQIAYTELYITDRFWPAFRRPQLYEAIRDFQDRERRFGRVEE